MDIFLVNRNVTNKPDKTKSNFLISYLVHMEISQLI